MARLRLKSAFAWITATAALIASAQSGASVRLYAPSQGLASDASLHALHSHHDHDGSSLTHSEAHDFTDSSEHQQHSHKHRHSTNGEEHEHAHRHPVSASAAPQVAIAPSGVFSLLRIFTPVALIPSYLRTPVSESPSVIFRPPISS